MYTDIHRKGCGCGSIVVLSLWSENSAKLAVFYVHGYSFGFAQIRQNSFVFVRRAHAQFAQAWSGMVPWYKRPVSPFSETGLIVTSDQYCIGGEVQVHMLTVLAVITTSTLGCSFLEKSP